MKNRFKIKASAVILAITLLFGCFAVTAFARDTASEFISAVNAISTANGLENEENALLNAESVLEVHLALGGSTEDDAIKETYLNYLILKADIEERVGYCVEYAELVDILSQTELTYSEAAAYIARLKQLEPLTDSSYTGMEDLYEQLFVVEVEMRAPILTCEAYIETCLSAANAKTYEEAYTLTKRAKMIDGQIATVDGNISYLDYPGLTEARANLETAERFMQFRLIEASDFLIAVRNINKAVSIPAGIANAYAKLEGIDQTTDGVPSALETLKNMERNYNKSAEYANDRIAEINSMIFGFIF